jgi:hypothetical protein
LAPISEIVSEVCGFLLVLTGFNVGGVKGPLKTSKNCVLTPLTYDFTDGPSILDQLLPQANVDAGRRGDFKWYGFTFDQTPKGMS